MSTKLMELLKQSRAKAARQKTIKPDNGRNRYRILPTWVMIADPANPANKVRDPDAKFWAEWGQHFIKNAKGEVLAVYMCTDKTFGKPCDVCSALQHAANHIESDAQAKQLDDAKANPRILLNVLWLENGGKASESEPQVLEVAPSVFNGQKGVGGVAALFDEWPDLIHPERGMEIIVERSGTGKDTRYGVQVAGNHKGPKVVDKSILDKIHNLDLFVAQESESEMRRALTSIGSITGRPVALPAPTPQLLPAAAASKLDQAQDAALRELEGASHEHVKSTPAPAPAAAPQPQAAQPAPAPAQPAAAPAASTGGDDAELDNLLSSLG